MRSEVFYSKSLREHFKTTHGFSKKGWLAKQALSFICDNHSDIPIHIHPHFDDVEIIGCIIDTLWDVILYARLEFKVNGIYYTLYIQQTIYDNDIIKVETRDTTYRWKI